MSTVMNADIVDLKSTTDAADNACVLYIDQTTDVVAHTTTKSLYVNMIQAGSPVGEPRALSSGSSYIDATSIISNDRGDLVVTWRDYSSAAHGVALFAAIYDSVEHTWSPATQISGNSEYVSNPMASINETGDVVVTWVSRTQTSPSVSSGASIWCTNGTWTAIKRF